MAPIAPPVRGGHRQPWQARPPASPLVAAAAARSSRSSRRREPGRPLHPPIGTGDPARGAHRATTCCTAEQWYGFEWLGVPRHVEDRRRQRRYPHDRRSGPRRNPPFWEFGIRLFRVRAPSYISSCVHFKFPIIVGTAGGLPQNFGHSSRGTSLRSVAATCGLEPTGSPCDAGAFRPRCHFPQNRTNADRKPARRLQTRN
jgi:hypothetical protein